MTAGPGERAFVPAFGRRWTQRWEGSRPRDPAFPKPNAFVDRVTRIRL